MTTPDTQRIEPALDIGLIVLGSLFLFLTLILLLVGAYFYRKRINQTKQRESSFYADRPVQPIVTSSEKQVHDVEHQPEEHHAEQLTKTIVEDELSKEERKVSSHRPSHIAIPSLHEVSEATADKALSYDTNINIEEFVDHVNEYHSKDDTVFLDEFEMLSKASGFNCSERKSMIESEQNMKRNRFMDVLPYDDNRVPLQQGEHGYINASFIDGYEKPRMFIATQGPLGDTEVSVTSGRRFATVEDFWSMVWEHDVQCIIMLTQCVENCRPKCAKYWPSSVGEASTFGEITVDLMSTTDDPICLHREFDVTKDGEKKEISQFHFKEWEDSKAPESREHLLDFVERIRKGRHTPPILVHCSAGVGRTGVFIALCNLLNQLDDTSTTHLDVFRTVSQLREQRVRMVQTPEQYITLYDTLSAAIQTRRPMDEVCLDGAQYIDSEIPSI